MIPRSWNQPPGVSFNSVGVGIDTGGVGIDSGGVGIDSGGVGKTPKNKNKTVSGITLGFLKNGVDIDSETFWPKFIWLNLKNQPAPSRVGVPMEYAHAPTRWGLLFFKHFGQNLKN